MLETMLLVKVIGGLLTVLSTIVTGVVILILREAKKTNGRLRELEKTGFFRAGEEHEREKHINT